MTIAPVYERRLLQFAIFIAGFVPVLAGAGGANLGSAFLGEITGTAMDSHFRYLSGILLAIGLCFWSFIPKIEQKEPQAKILTILVLTGGLIRLLSALLVIRPPVPMMLAIGMEVIVTPLLYLWIKRIARRS